MKSASLAAGIVLGCLTACASPQATIDLPALISAGARPAADIGRDTSQKALPLLVFASVTDGQAVADFAPGGGYWTRLFSTVVGPRGRVYGLVPTTAAGRPAPPALASNVTLVQGDFPDIILPEPVDVFWSSRNFRELYAGGRDKARVVLAGIYGAVKPGGTLIVIDHAASPAMPLADQVALGRIDPRLVRADAEAAGFVFVAGSDVLANAEDDHTKVIIDPAIAGHTDQFVFRFRKPR